jgi:HSP20 family protein
MKYTAHTRPNGTRTQESDFDKLFEAVFGSSSGWNTRQPRVDVTETEDGYELVAELPGFTEKDVEVSVEDNLLTISASQTEDSDDRRYLIRERGRAEYRRSFVLPKDADRSAISARVRHGMLVLDIQKLPEAKPRQIKIQGE